MRFDDIYETVGVFGTYQKVKYFLLCFTNMLPAVMVYAWTFIAATPSFDCTVPTMQSNSINSNFTVYQSIPNESQCFNAPKRIAYKECTKCYRFVNLTDGYSTTSQLEPCSHFTFKKDYFQSTLVEEVSLKIIFQEHLRTDVTFFRLNTMLLVDNGL